MEEHKEIIKAFVKKNKKLTDERMKDELELEKEVKELQDEINVSKRQIKDCEMKSSRWPTIRLNIVHNLILHEKQLRQAS